MRVTIGIPVYNCETWILESIQSALNQTWNDKEVIVVDDGSTDRTSELCCQFGNQIRYFRQKNAGANNARNKILKESTGEWIQYLDADDYLLPKKIETCIHFLPNPERVNVIFSDLFMEYYRNGKLINRYPTQFNLSDGIVEKWVDQLMPQAGGLLWKKKTLEILGGWDETLDAHQDTEIYLRLLQSGIPFHYLNQPLAAYRLWSSNAISFRQPSKRGLIYAGLLDRCEAWLRSEGNWTDSLKEILCRCRFRIAREIAQADIGLADQYYRKEKQANQINIDDLVTTEKYRMIFRLLGFKKAEQIAKFLRQMPFHQSKPF
jgi:glycosyltransferase involved in cell wall biosynthesis